jgi:thermitase
MSVLSENNSPSFRVGGRILALHEGTHEDEIRETLKHRPGILHIEKNNEITALFNPNDQYFPGNGRYQSSRAGLIDQWGLTRIDCPRAWDLTRQRGGDVVIAILDTGVDVQHPDLVNRLIRGTDGAIVGYNTVNHSNTIIDDNGHGTHVSGIASAVTDNSLGVSGVAFSSSRIMPVKVLDAQGSGTDFGVAQGIIWAADHGARIINMSLGGATYSHSIQLAVNYAWLKGVLVIAAAGNDGEMNINYPAGNNMVLGIGATEQDGTTSDYSNSGRHVDCVAPGSDYLSTMPTRSVYLNQKAGFLTNYDALSGTSMATPVVSGLASLICATYPNATNAQVRMLITQTCQKTRQGSRGWAADDGYGEVRASSAIYQEKIKSGLGCVTGQIVDAVGLAMNGVQVMAGGLVATTDSAGMFRLPNLPSETEVQVSASSQTKSGYRTVVQRAMVPDNADADITIVFK